MDTRNVNVILLSIDYSQTLIETIMSTTTTKMIEKLFG